MEVLFKVLKAHFILEDFRVLEAIFDFVQRYLAAHSIEHC